MMIATSRSKFSRCITGVAGLTVFALGLAGCEMGSIQLSGPLPGGATSGARLSGMVHGGQYPIYNAQIQLYAAGAPAAPTGSNPIVGGLGQGATPLIAPGSMTVGSTNNFYPSGAHGCTYTTGNTNSCTVLPSTNASGSFLITNDYSCSGAGEVYIVASGGDPTGAASSSINNQYITLMAALGPCSGLSASTNIIINEVTTVAAVYASNQFMATPSTTSPGVPAGSYASQGGATAGIGVNIGASSGPVGGYGGVQTQQVGMTNAFSMVNNIADYSTGAANPVSTNTWAVPYSAMTYTIADILAACVNTNPAVSATNCTNLMSYAKPGSVSLYPADTVQAAFMMARYPQGVNVASLYGLIAGSGTPFTQDLSSAPNEYTIQVGYQTATPGTNSLLAATGCANSYGTNGTNCAISNPVSGALDEYGNMWIWNYNPQGSTPYAKSFLTEIGSNGALLAGPFNSYTAHGGYQVSGADPCATSYTHYLSYSANNSQAIAIDQTNTVWVTNAQEATNAGGISGGNCTSTGANALMRITGSNANGTGAALTTGYYDEYAIGSIAFDGADNAWLAQSLGTQSSAGYPISTLTNSGTFATGGFNVFQSINLAIDTSGGSSGGTTSGNVWTGSTYICGSYGVLYESPTSSVSAPTLTGGYYGTNVTCTAGTLVAPTQQVNNGAGLGNPYGVAVDKNNGIWVANYKNASGTYSNTASYLLPTSSTWVSSGSQASPNTTTPIPTTAANTAQNAGSNTYSYGLSNPGWVAVDGSNIAWVANLSSSYLSPLQVSVSGGNIASLTSPSVVGGGASGLKMPGGAIPQIPSAGASWDAVDPSGNLWIFSAKAQSGTATTQTNYVTVVVGVATPVITPLSYQVKYNRIGQTPQ